MALAWSCRAGLLLTTTEISELRTQHEHTLPRKERAHRQKECLSVYTSCDYRCLTDISESDSPDLDDHLSRQRVSPSKPSPSLTTLADRPGSCPSRRAPRCCCTSGRQKTGGRDGTMVSMAWCHTSTSSSKMCKFYFVLFWMWLSSTQVKSRITYVWLMTKVMRDTGLTWNYLDDFLELEWRPDLHWTVPGGFWFEN